MAASIMPRPFDADHRNGCDGLRSEEASDLGNVPQCVAGAGGHDDSWSRCGSRAVAKRWVATDVVLLGLMLPRVLPRGSVPPRWAAIAAGRGEGVVKARRALLKRPRRQLDPDRSGGAGTPNDWTADPASWPGWSGFLIGHRGLLPAGFSGHAMESGYPDISWLLIR
jgi:hypothetical protein